MKSTGGLFSFGALGGGSVRYPPEKLHIRF